MSFDRHGVNHTADCHSEDVRRVLGSMGDTLDRCAGCGRFAVVDAPPPGRVGADHGAAAGVPGASRYRCRVHPEQPVTWRGTGCPDCHAEKVERAARCRRARRLAVEANWSMV